MGIFVVDTKGNWDRVVEALKTWRRRLDMGDERTLYGEKDEDGKTEARRLMDELEVEVKEALEPVRIDEVTVWNHVQKLLLMNNMDRALKLIAVVRSDIQLRWGWAFLLGIVLLPFRLVYAMIRRVLP